MMWRLANSVKPTIGAINGLAYGGAAALASALDIRVGCERSAFRFPGAAYGRLNSTWTLPQVVGWARAKELLFTARVVEADEALQIGLLNSIVAAASVLDSALELAGQIAANSPETVQGIKQILHADVGVPMRQRFEAERRVATTTLLPGDARQNFQAFLSTRRDRHDQSDEHDGEGAESVASESGGGGP